MSDPAVSSAPASDLLRLEGVTAGYGDGIVLNDVSLAVAPGESLAVLGRNGVGKSTLLETIMGNTRLRRGQIHLGDRNVTRLPPHARVKAGIGWVPQEREVFPSLTVEEHLTVVGGDGPWTVARVYEVFPRLAERRRNYGNQLSGGEQQMLAIGRALMTNPRLLLLDEPMEGLAPIVVEDLSERVVALSKDEGSDLHRGRAASDRRAGAVDQCRFPWSAARSSTRRARRRSPATTRRSTACSGSATSRTR